MTASSGAAKPQPKLQPSTQLVQSALAHAPVNAGTAVSKAASAGEKEAKTASQINDLVFDQKNANGKISFIDLFLPQYQLVLIHLKKVSIERSQEENLNFLIQFKLALESVAIGNVKRLTSVYQMFIAKNKQGEAKLNLADKLVEQIHLALVAAKTDNKAIPELMKLFVIVANTTIQMLVSFMPQEQTLACIAVIAHAKNPAAPIEKTDIEQALEKCRMALLTKFPGKFVSNIDKSIYHRLEKELLWSRFIFSPSLDKHKNKDRQLVALLKGIKSVPLKLSSAFQAIIDSQFLELQKNHKALVDDTKPMTDFLIQEGNVDASLILGKSDTKKGVENSGLDVKATAEKLSAVRQEIFMRHMWCTAPKKRENYFALNHLVDQVLLFCNTYKTSNPKKHQGIYKLLTAMKEIDPTNPVAEILLVSSLLKQHVSEAEKQTDHYATWVKKPLILSRM